MNIERLIKKQAKQYHKRSFEAKLAIGIVAYLVILVIAIGDLIVRFSLRCLRLVKTILASIRIQWKKLTVAFAQTPRVFRSLLHFLFPTPQHRQKERRHQPSVRPPRRHSRRLLPELFAVSFPSKLKYALFGAVLSCLFIFFPLLLILFIQDLPSPRELSLRHIPQTTKIFDRNGVLLSEVYAAQNRTLVTLSEVPTHLQYATLAIEDKNFYRHPGFDIASIIRALKENVMEGRRIQGGSTITQQLMKSSMLTPEKSIYRKLKEVALAFWAERIYTKDQILEMYFNQVPYGGTAWGVEAASEVYFGKHVSKLTLAESAFLAGITAAPTTYSPYGENPTLWKSRQNEVLSRMVSLNYITRKEADDAAKQQLLFQKPQTALHAPHFVAYVKDLLINTYGLALVEKGGLQVTTSLDLKTQQMAEKIVREEVAKASYLNISNGAALITNPENGDILAMVGSKNYDEPGFGKVNIATSLRQPGSTVKVITYSAALANGFTAATILEDSPTSFPNSNAAPYVPVNYDGRYYGRVPVRFALANSLNLPAVKILDKIGVETMVSLGREMGITSWQPSSEYGLAVTLGGAEVTMLDMATINATLANQGIRVDLDPILKITDIKENMIKEKKENNGYRVLSEGISFIVSDILADNAARSSAFGPNSPLVIPGHTVSVKTGTSDNKRDNWTIGYTNNFVTVTWVGNNDNSPMNQSLASGITGAAPIWHRIMSGLLEVDTEIKLSAPQGVVTKNCFGRTEYFLSGTESSMRCTIPITPLERSTNAVQQIPGQRDSDRQNDNRGRGRENRRN